MKPRCVFLDRDGVLNELVNGTSPKTIREVRVPWSVYEACQRLSRAAFDVVSVTNQPDVARGKMTLAEAAAINGMVRRFSWIVAIYMCPHDDADQCECRKPKPGLLYKAVDEFGYDLERSWMVGDRHTDVLAGKAAGCRTIRIGEEDADATFSCGSFDEAVEIILRES